LKDSSGVSQNISTIFYTSSSQINFLIPAGVSFGAATVTNGAQIAPLQINAVAPSLYTLDASGLAAASAIQVGPGGTQTPVQIYYVVNGVVFAAPLSLSPSTNQVYLVLYGTGIRGAGNNVSVTIGGINAPLIYSGPQGADPGLDQVNVLIPAQLTGRGTVNIILTAAGLTANTVNIVIQ
jgi:uncharacterized protein (TIGR03437 family)